MNSHRQATPEGVAVRSRYGILGRLGPAGAGRGGIVDPEWGRRRSPEFSLSTRDWTCRALHSAAIQMGKGALCDSPMPQRG